jgi:hypothetical protein
VLVGSQLGNELKEKGLKRAKIFTWEQTTSNTYDLYKSLG